MWPPNSSDLNSVDYCVWGILQERSTVRDVKELKERLLREWRLLDHSIIAAAIAQWRSRLSGYVHVNGGHFEHRFCTTFCSALFVLSILLLVNLMDVSNVQSASIGSMERYVLLLCLRLLHSMFVGSRQMLLLPSCQRHLC